MSTDHAEKTHPIAGYVTAVVLGVGVYYLAGALNDMTTAYFVAPFAIGWALVSLAIFGKLDESEKTQSQH